ncbi:MAG: hypothetical protein ICV63_07710 [Coleofasciculus sp. Co-bin14]|nr:hypothetical protein [Coleofasciculus sp. Co-bin14]
MIRTFAMRFYASIALLSFLTISLSAVSLIRGYRVISQPKVVTFSQQVAAQSQIEGDKPPHGGRTSPRSFASSHKIMTS